MLAQEPRCQVGAEHFSIVAAVAEQDAAGLHGVEHVRRRAAVMGLTFGESEPDRPPLGADQRMDLRRQAAA